MILEAQSISARHLTSPTELLRRLVNTPDHYSTDYLLTCLERKVRTQPVKIEVVGLRPSHEFILLIDQMQKRGLPVSVTWRQTSRPWRPYSSYQQVREALRAGETIPLSELRGRLKEPISKGALRSALRRLQKEGVITRYIRYGGTHGTTSRIQVNS